MLFIFQNSPTRMNKYIIIKISHHIQGCEFILFFKVVQIVYAKTRKRPK